MTDDTRAAPTPEATAPEPTWADLLAADKQRLSEALAFTEEIVARMRSQIATYEATVAALTAERTELIARVEELEAHDILGDHLTD